MTLQYLLNSKKKFRPHSTSLLLIDKKSHRNADTTNERLFFPWVRMAFVHPIGEMLELAAGKSTKHANSIAWYERIGQREAVQHGLLIPEANPPEVQMEIFVNAVVGLGGLHR
jgi:hypothetical protein